MEKFVAHGRTLTFHIDGPSLVQAVRGRVSSVASGRDRVDASAPAVVLIHGFPLNARVWSDVAARLAVRYRVIRPNLRGFGPFLSDEDFSIEELAGDVRALLHELDALPCVMAGLSMGGYVTLAYADQWAEDLLSLVLVNTRARADGDDGRSAREATARLAEVRGTAQVVQDMLPNMLAPGTYDSRPAVAETLLRIMLDTAAPTVSRASLAMRDRKDYTALLADLDLPVHVVAGRHDAIVPFDEARSVADTARHGTLSQIDNAGHMTPLEDPEAVAAIIEDAAERAFATSRN